MVLIQFIMQLLLLMKSINAVGCINEMNVHLYRISLIK